MQRTVGWVGPDQESARTRDFSCREITLFFPSGTFSDTSKSVPLGDTFTLFKGSRIFVDGKERLPHTTVPSNFTSGLRTSWGKMKLHDTSYVKQNTSSKSLSQQKLNPVFFSHFSIWLKLPKIVTFSCSRHFPRAHKCHQSDKAAVLACHAETNQHANSCLCYLSPCTQPYHLSTM